MTRATRRCEHVRELALDGLAIAALVVIYGGPALWRFLRGKPPAPVVVPRTNIHGAR